MLHARSKELLIGTLAVVMSSGVVLGQSGPVNGMRPADVRTHAIQGARIVVAPGQVLEDATVLMRDGVIVAVGASLDVPATARVWSGDGLTIYPGFIDAAVLVDAGGVPDGAGAHWNRRVHPQVEMSERPPLDGEAREELRELGFTTAAVYPAEGIWRGTGMVVALAEDDEHALAYRDRAMMAAGFSRGGGYPGSLMGAIALSRQTLSDAQWHAACRRVWAEHPEGNEPPIRADALVALADAVEGRQVVLFETTDALGLGRASRIAQEFDLDAVMLGSGLEFQRLPDVVASGHAIVLPLRTPDAPEAASLAEADDVTLRALMTWEQAPTNPRRLVDAGVSVALTTHALEKRSEFGDALRRAVQHGLSEQDALAALTTVPAKLLGLDAVLGTIEPGKVANLVVLEGSIFEDEPTMRSVWINGRRVAIDDVDPFEFAGTARLVTDGGFEAPLALDTSEEELTLRPDTDDELEAEGVTVDRDRISFLLSGEPLGVEGTVQFGGVLSAGTITGTGRLPNGDRFAFDIVDVVPADDDGETVALAEEDEDEDEEDEEDFVMPPDALVFPVGAYGLDETPQREDVLLINATIWTSGPQGIVENGAMLVQDGRIRGVYDRVPSNVPASVRRIDLAGRHVTPGLIDCHSHTGISSGVNEGGQTVTSEVRIGDVINPDDIGWYRELAGGLTAANQLHGSANPIGGQNSVVKLRWGDGASLFPVEGAKPGIKFALGENVVRRTDRYPNTRMGVETVIRDAFTAARDYAAEHAAYAALSPAARQLTYPPRRDLELDALVEILDGDRIIHCHSYRQDEILMLIRVAEDFGFRIGTFQHVLEGYKVAESIAQHGAGASSFSDWWAYKIEVMDAIPYNGALMTDVGVNVSFNSDSGELARRMNTEASKAVRYGGLAPAEALKLVTINPAWQLGIDQRTGSLEVGKDADFAIWSAGPLSTYARCEQTWIEGACYFDLESDLAMRQTIAAERERLLERLFAAERGSSKRKGKKGGADEEGRPTRRGVVAWHQSWIEDALRDGRDPTEIRPGDCGITWLETEANQ